MLNNELISVIVPIYNVELYLRKCVDSILNQTHRNLEIILVDDGSPDKCGVICDEYAKMDKRVKVIHKPNGGLSDARNAGLEIMTGDYVGFVDSDDWIEPDMYTKLLELLQRFHADMAFGGVADELESNGVSQITKRSNYGEKPFFENRVEAMQRYFYGSWAAWDKLYKSSVFENIRYPVGEINEDEAIVLKLLDRCNRVCYTNDICYHYMTRKNSGSITASAFTEKKLAWQNHCKMNLAFIREKYPELEQAAAVRYRNSLLWSLTEMAMSDREFLLQIRELKEALKENRKLFRTAPFRYRQDKIRCLVLTYLPFNCYKTLLRLKRKDGVIK